MENIILSSFESKMRRLPPKIKAVLIAPETGDLIEAACQKHDVENRVFSYSGLVGLILMGELNPNLLVKSIVEKENIDTEKAKLIALDISAAIFQPIKQELITMYGLTQKPAAPTVTPPTPRSRPEPVEWAPPPSTREAGTSLPEIPPPGAYPPFTKSRATLQSVAENPLPAEKSFYSPIPQNRPEPARSELVESVEGQAPSINSGQAKPNVIDLSKEPPRPVAQPGDPPLEGNIVNLKQINNQ